MTAASILCGILLVAGTAWLALRKARRAVGKHQGDSSSYDLINSSVATDDSDAFRRGDHADCGVAVRIRIRVVDASPLAAAPIERTIGRAVAA